MRTWQQGRAVMLMRGSLDHVVHGVQNVCKCLRATRSDSMATREALLQRNACSQRVDKRRIQRLFGSRTPCAACSLRVHTDRCAAILRSGTQLHFSTSKSSLQISRPIKPDMLKHMSAPSVWPWATSKRTCCHFERRSTRCADAGTASRALMLAWLRLSVHGWRTLHPFG